MPLTERCTIVKVMNCDGNTAYVEECDVPHLPPEQEFTIVSRAVAFFSPVDPDELPHRVTALP